MEPTSLSFLTYNVINEIQSYMVGGFRGLGGLCFQDNQVKGTTEQGTDAGRSNKYYHWPIATESLQLYS